MGEHQIGHVYAQELQEISRAIEEVKKCLTRLERLAKEQTDEDLMQATSNFISGTMVSITTSSMLHKHNIQDALGYLNDYENNIFSHPFLQTRHPSYLEKSNLFRFHTISIRQLYFEITQLMHSLEHKKSLKDLDEQFKEHQAILSDLMKRSNDLKEFLPKFEKSMDSQIKAAEKRQSEFVKFLDDQSTVASNIASAYVAEEIGDNYFSRSKEEDNLANRFRLFSLILMGVVLILDLAFVVYGIGWVGFDKIKTSSVIAMSFLLYVPAIYLTKESARHRKVQHANMKMSQDMKAGLAFISTLSNEEQVKLRSAIALMIFSSKSAGDDKDDANLFLSQDLLSQVLNVAKSETKKAKAD